MVVGSNITHNSLPKQGDDVGKQVAVCFHYDTNNIVEGTIVRDDIESPYETIIQLKNGNYVRGTECQYSFNCPKGKAVISRD